MKTTRLETLKNLNVYRDMVKALLEHLIVKAETVKGMSNKTPKDVAEISVKIFKAQIDLFTTQYQINSLITTKGEG